MPEINYDSIRDAWTAEIDNEHLQPLEDLKLNKMIDYLSGVRLKLAETNAKDRVQFRLLTQEALNLEFMIRDLLSLRRDKIIKSSFLLRRPMGTMTLSEEEFYNRLLRGFEGHKSFVEEVLAGNLSPTLTITSDESEKNSESSTRGTSKEGELEYVIVRFLKPINDAFLGMDELTYGPYEEGNIATIPVDNARTWLRDGTVTRVMMESDEGDE